MRNNYLHITYIFITFFFFGCDLPNYESEIEFSHSVLFNLVINNDSQEIYIYQSAPIKDSLNSYNLSEYFEHNAILSLESDNFFYNNFSVKISSQIRDLSKVFYYTNNSQLNLYSDTEYILKMKINDKIISGITHSPSNFEILEPKNNVVIQQESPLDNFRIEIIWSKCYRAMGYIGEIIKTNTIILPDTNFIQISKSNFITQDTSFLLTNFLGKGKYEINIIAYDENFHNHFFKNISSSGVDGAYGYFGSSIKKTRIINVLSE